MKPQAVAIHTSLKDLFSLFFTSAQGAGAMVVLILGGLISWFFVGASDWKSPLYKVLEVNITQGYVTSSDDTNYLIDEETVIHYFYSFIANDMTYQGDSYSHQTFLQDGDAVEVLYLVSDPSISKILETRNAPWSPWLILILILPLIGVRLFIGGLRDVNRSSGLLANGWVTLASKGQMRNTGMTVNERRVIRATYHFQVKGTEHECHTQSSSPDELKEELMIVFTGDPPTNITFVKDLTNGVREKILTKLGLNNE